MLQQQKDFTTCSEVRVTYMCIDAKFLGLYGGGKEKKRKRREKMREK